MALTPRGIEHPDGSTKVSLYQILRRLALSIDTALGVLTQVENSSSGFTAGVGWSLVSYQYRRVGPTLASWSVTVSRTGGAISVPADGNIPNQTLGFVTATQRPVVGSPLTVAGTGRGAFGGIWTSGSIDLTAVAGSLNITTGDQIQLAGFGFMA